MTKSNEKLIKVKTDFVPFCPKYPNTTSSAGVDCMNIRQSRNLMLSNSNWIVFNVKQILYQFNNGKIGNDLKSSNGGKN